MLIALMALGAVCSPASPMFQPSELARQVTSAKVGRLRLLYPSEKKITNVPSLHHSQANFIITHKDLRGVAIDAADLAGIPRKHIYTMGEDSGSRLKSIKCVRYLFNGLTLLSELQ